MAARLNCTSESTKGTFSALSGGRAKDLTPVLRQLTNAELIPDHLLSIKKKDGMEMGRCVTLGRKGLCLMVWMESG